MQLQQSIEQTKAKLESEDAAQLATLTKHDVVGDLIYGTIFSYFALNDVQDEIQAQASDIVTYRLPSFGIFSTKVQTNYWFGTPRSVSFSGLQIDVDLMHFQTVAKAQQPGFVLPGSIATDPQVIAFHQAAGARGSAMEHLVPEQIFSTPEVPAQGISAVKALAIAGAEGQKIWTITQNNLAAALDSIQLDPETETEIRSAVNAGKTATAHELPINFHGWVGEGYILLDPQTGAGAYKVAGGANGGFLDFFGVELIGTLTLLDALLFVLGVLSDIGTAILTPIFAVTTIDLLLTGNCVTDSYSLWLSIFIVGLFAFALLALLIWPALTLGVGPVIWQLIIGGLATVVFEGIERACSATE